MAATAAAQRGLDAEVAAMSLEDERSRRVEAEILAGEAMLKEREAYLQGLYTSFVPLWGGTLDGTPPEEEARGAEEGSKPTMWWKGADAPQIWAGPREPHRVPRPKPGLRFVPHARVLLDGLETQAVSVGRLSREYLALLGLPYESIRDMYEQVKSTLRCCLAGVEVWFTLGPCHVAHLW